MKREVLLKAMRFAEARAMAYKRYKYYFETAKSYSYFFLDY